LQFILYYSHFCQLAKIVGSKTDKKNTFPVGKTRIITYKHSKKMLDKFLSQFSKDRLSAQSCDLRFFFAKIYQFNLILFATLG
jgi:hypothetical protein